MEWFNQPPAWDDGGATITVHTGSRTDFWRTTHYGFIRDSGHFYYRPVAGDFTAEVEVRGRYQDLYDQAGLMVRQDAHTWMKCGIEFVEGVQQASAVVTREYSDWSVAPLAANPPAIRLRVVRRGAALEVSYSLDGAAYTLLRLAYLAEGPVQVGPMCASPDGAGFDVTFAGFRVRDE
jgi:regulation of enolase protein 1 (concanavalin A-like superfamily)